jgi:SAM-dependent methyltransferase
MHAMQTKAMERIAVEDEKQTQYDLIAAYYDLFKSRSMEDYPFYLDLARKTGGPVLEPACGTGRLLIELAKEGFQVTGVDISPGMLACARSKLERSSREVIERVKLIHGSMHEALPDEEYGLIFVAAGGLFQNQSDEERSDFLVACRSRLKPNGYFAFDVFFWDDGDYEGWGERCGDGRVTYDGSWEVPEGTIQRFRSDVKVAGSNHFRRTVFCDHVTHTGEIRRVTLKDNEYYVPPKQLKAELEAAGFAHVEQYGGFSREPLYDPALKGRGAQVYIARP